MKLCWCFTQGNASGAGHSQNKCLLAAPQLGSYFRNIREDMTIIVFASNPSCQTISMNCPIPSSILLSRKFPSWKPKVVEHPQKRKFIMYLKGTFSSGNFPLQKGWVFHFPKCLLTSFFSFCNFFPHKTQQVSYERTKINFLSVIYVW